MGAYLGPDLVHEITGRHFPPDRYLLQPDEFSEFLFLVGLLLLPVAHVKVKEGTGVFGLIVRTTDPHREGTVLVTRKEGLTTE